MGPSISHGSHTGWPWLQLRGNQNRLETEEEKNTTKEDGEIGSGWVSFADVNKASRQSGGEIRFVCLCGDGRLFINSPTHKSDSNSQRLARNVFPCFVSPTDWIRIFILILTKKLSQLSGVLMTHGHVLYPSLLHSLVFRERVWHNDILAKCSHHTWF